MYWYTLDARCGTEALQLQYARQMRISGHGSVDRTRDAGYIGALMRLEGKLMDRRSVSTSSVGQGPGTGGRWDMYCITAAGMMVSQAAEIEHE